MLLSTRMNGRPSSAATGRSASNRLRQSAPPPSPCAPTLLFSRCVTRSAAGTPGADAYSVSVAKLSTPPEKPVATPDGVAPAGTSLVGRHGDRVVIRVHDSHERLEVMVQPVQQAVCHHATDAEIAAVAHSRQQECHCHMVSSLGEQFLVVFGDGEPQWL